MRPDLMNIEDYEDAFEDQAPENRLIQACEDGQHIWMDTYYGVACRKCGMFVQPDFWDDTDADEGEHEPDCRCVLCEDRFYREQERYYEAMAYEEMAAEDDDDTR